MKVLFNDLTYQNNIVKPEILEIFKESFHRSVFIGGIWVQEFEEKFAAYIGVRHCIGVGNCTDALELILEGLGIGHGDEVIVPAYSWISTAACVKRVGATPVFVDVHPDSYTMDPELLDKNINSKTKGIITVHFYGQSADMDAIGGIANKYNINIIEDCAQASGSLYKDNKVGSIGIAGAFSFYPTKNLGAFGDGGCVTTNSDELAHRIRLLANHGLKDRNQHVLLGRNSRLDSLQAKILEIKLNYLNEWNELRISAAKQYLSGLQGSRIKLPKVLPQTKHIFHLYVVQVENRKEVINFLDEKGIHTAIHYPIPIPETKPFPQGNDQSSKYPVSARMSGCILSLPIFPGITEDQIEFTCDAILEAISVS